MSPFYDPDDVDLDEENDVPFEEEEEDPIECEACGCTEEHACEGGCVWATPTRCSRCVE